MAYNPASQIASETRTNDAYAWTGHANVDRNYTTNGLNQYTAAGPASFTYDANGNLTSDGSNTYVYDVENRLVSRSGGGTSATLRYDPLGRLYEVSGSASGVTRFLYDGDALVGEYNSAGTMLRRYVHGAAEGVDDPLVWFEGAGVAGSARRYLYADERGSIVAVTDGNGNKLAINTYDEYGIPGSGNTGRFQYTGQAWVPELGMYYYKARMYSPTLGRFMQTDPIGYADGMNWYNYVGGDPVNAVDPTGLACEDTPSTTSAADGGGGGEGCIEVIGKKECSLGHGCSILSDPFAIREFLAALGRNGLGGEGYQIVVTANKPESDEEPSTLEKAGQCALDQLGLDELAAAGAVAAGQPIPGTKRFVTPGSSRGTSAAGLAANKVFGNARLPTRLPTVVGGPGTGRALAVAGTKSAARFAGRAVPIVGWALLAYDAGSIAYCTFSGD